MKSVINQTYIKKQYNSQPNTTRQAANLQQVLQQNKQCQQNIIDLEAQAKKLTQDNQKFDQQIADKRAYIEMLKKQIIVQQCQCQGQCNCPEIGNHQQDEGQQLQEEKQNGEQQMDMENWMGQAQGYTGLSQEVINCLIQMQYQGSPDQQDICLSCYQAMQCGNKSKYLPCSHLFHSDCINSHLKMNKSCPACGQEVIIL